MLLFNLNTMVLSKFLSKSKPFVFLILGLYISIHFWFSAVQLSTTINFVDVGKYSLLLVLFFGVNFIVKRNKINQQNTFATFSFAMLATFFPAFFLDVNYLIPAFFLTLGLRRLISLKSQIDSKKKIFDASLWFFVASLFQPYLLLMMLLVFLGILQYTLYDPKNLFIPIIAWVCGGLFFTAYQLWQTGEWMFFYEYYTGFGLNDFASIWQSNQLALSMLIPFVLFVLFITSRVISKAQLALKTSLILLLFTFVFILFGWMFALENQVGGLALAFIPLSMLSGCSLEVNLKPILKEIILGLLLIVSVASFFS